MDIATFKAEYPEFSTQSDPNIQGALNDAASRLAAAEWGDRYDLVVGLLAADSLWNSPFGATMRQDGGDKSDKKANFYYEQYETVLAETVLPMLVT